MCDPLSAAMMAVQGAGMLSSAYGSYQQSAQQQAMAQYNAQLAGMAARDATAQGERAVQHSQLQTAQLKGAQRAALAASGVDPGQGTALNVLASTDYRGEQDAAMLRYHAARQAWGYRTKGAQYRWQADQISPWGAAIGSLLGGAGQAAPQWYSLYKVYKG